MYLHTPEQIKAIETLFNRYRQLAEQHTSRLNGLPYRCQAQGLIGLCTEAATHHGKYPFDKLNRSLGFVQGVLACIGAIDVDEERDFTRPLLHAFHQEKPPSFAS